MTKSGILFRKAECIFPIVNIRRWNDVDVKKGDVAMLELLMDTLVCFLVFDALHIMTKLSKMEKELKEIKKLVEDLRITQMIKNQNGRT